MDQWLFFKNISLFLFICIFILLVRLTHSKGNMQDSLQNIPKVNLEDFSYKIDLSSRLQLENLSVDEIFILEELLYSPLKTTTSELADITEIDESSIEESIKSLLPLNLFTYADGNITTSKERRKFFETIIVKFNKKFTPNLDYYKDLLKQVPIHFLISWFHIPRTSNNIFNSIVEKHFSTPKVFLKYVNDALTDTPELKKLFDTVCSSDEGFISFEEAKEILGLNEEELEEKILFLEHHYILCSCYKIKGGKFEKKIALFKEWKNFLDTSQNKDDSQGITPDQHHLIQKQSDEEFSFILDMSKLLQLCETSNLQVQYNPKEELFFLSGKLDKTEAFFSSCKNYLARVINKNLLLGLLVIENDCLMVTPPSKKWLETDLKQRTLITFKHPHNSLSHNCNFSFKIHDRNIIEIQKALSLVEKGAWILLEEFINRYLLKTNTLKQPTLTKAGKKWQYTTPEYNTEELMFIKVVITDWLFESGMVIPGMFENQICFKVTSLGHELYS